MWFLQILILQSFRMCSLFACEKFEVTFSSFRVCTLRVARRVTRAWQAEAWTLYLFAY